MNCLRSRFVAVCLDVAKRPSMSGVANTRELVAFLIGWFRGQEVADKQELVTEFWAWTTQTFKEPPANHWGYVLTKHLSPGESGFREFAGFIRRFEAQGDSKGSKRSRKCVREHRV